VLADHSKWGVVSLASFAPVEQVSVLVTDALFPADGRVALAGRVGEIVI
jgi:DeoR/GlpR family transcriptional regulator of sugar metabolism